MTLYRVIQEALTNVHKHTDASLVMIHIDFSDDQARLDIMDNGEGFDVNAWENSGAASYGLRGLQERLSLVGGSLGIQSQPRQTLLNVTLPHPTHA